MQYIQNIRCIIGFERLKIKTDDYDYRVLHYIKLGLNVSTPKEDFHNRRVCTICTKAYSTHADRSRSILFVQNTIILPITNKY